MAACISRRFLFDSVRICGALVAPDGDVCFRIEGTRARLFMDVWHSGVSRTRPMQEASNRRHENTSGSMSPNGTYQIQWLEIGGSRKKFSVVIHNSQNGDSLLSLPLVDQNQSMKYSAFIVSSKGAFCTFLLKSIRVRKTFQAAYQRHCRSIRHIAIWLEFRFLVAHYVNMRLRLTRRMDSDSMGSRRNTHSGHTAEEL